MIAFWRFTAFFALGLFVLVLYWPGLQGPFLLDDFHNIHLAHLTSWDKDRFFHLITSNNSGELGRPLSVLSLVFTGYFHGLDAWWFKYHNLLIHLLVGVGFFWLGFLLLRQWVDEQRAFWCSLLAVSLWLLHPLFVSTVLYPVQRMAQLSVVWVVYGAVAYVAARCSSSNRVKWVLYLLVPLLGLMAVFSKENGALLPLLLIPLELFLLRVRVQLDRLDKIARCSLVLLPSLLAVLATVALWDKLTNYDLRDYTLLERLYTQTQVIWFYIGQLFFPRLSSMGLYLDYWPYTTTLNVMVVLSVVSIVAVVTIPFFLRRYLLLGVGGAWFFIGHLMESTFIPLEMVFEHRNYLPAWGLFFALSSLTLLLPGKKTWLVALLFFGLIVGLTKERVGYWKSQQSLAVISSVYHPESFRAAMGFGMAAMKAGKYDLGREYYRKALALKPDRVGVHIFLVVSHCAGDAIPENVLDGARQGLENYPLDFYGAMAFRSLVVRIANGQCNAIQVEQLNELLGKINAGSQYRGTYFHLMGQVYDAYGDFARSSSYYGFAETASIDLNLVMDVVAGYTRYNKGEAALSYLHDMREDGRRRSAYEARMIDKFIGQLEEDLDSKRIK